MVAPEREVSRLQFGVFTLNTDAGELLKQAHASGSRTVPSSCLSRYSKSQEK